MAEDGPQAGVMETRHPQERIDDSGAETRPSRRSPDHNLVRRASRNPVSRKAAIEAMCFQCMGGTAESLPDPGWKNDIRHCTARDCALWPHRPYQESVSR